MSAHAALALAAMALGAAPASAAMPGSPAAERPEAVVAINDMAVDPVDLVVAPGTKILWANAGRKRHTVTSDTGAFDSGTLLPGERFSITAPMSVGSFSYHCRFHQFIRGTVTVSLVNLHAPAEVPYGRVATLTGLVPGADPGTQVSI
jgi:plastocyanin